MLSSFLLFVVVMVKEESLKESLSATLVTVYLLCYNIFSCAGWMLVLLLTIIHLVKFQLSHMNIFWEELQYPLKVMQTMMIFDLIHSKIGISKSSFSIMLPQVISRLLSLWVVMDMNNTVQESIFTVVILISWSLVDMSKYIYNVFNLVEIIPFYILWIRFSLFVVLYPISIIAELANLYLFCKVVIISKDQFINTLTGKESLSNTIILSLVIITGLSYLISPKLYLDMLKIRSKQLRKVNKLTILKQD